MVSESAIDRDSQIGAADEQSCWSCGDMRAAHFCMPAARCSRPPVDYFSFFGLPRKLNIEAARWSETSTS